MFYCISVSKLRWFGEWVEETFSYELKTFEGSFQRNSLHCLRWYSIADGLSENRQWCMVFPIIPGSSVPL